MKHPITINSRGKLSKQNSFINIARLYTELTQMGLIAKSYWIHESDYQDILEWNKQNRNKEE